MHAGTFFYVLANPLVLSHGRHHYFPKCEIWCLGDIKGTLEHIFRTPLNAKK